MKELGIVLDFKGQWITIDKIKLPMQNLKDLQDPNIVRFIAKNEPRSTMEMSKRVIKILDAKYEKADLSKMSLKHVITCLIPIRKCY